MYGTAGRSEALTIMMFDPENPSSDDSTGAFSSPPDHSTSPPGDLSSVGPGQKLSEAVTVLLGERGGLPCPTRLGRYEIVSELGRGGFGTVYIGHDPLLDRGVAIKVPQHAPSGALVGELLREARRMAQLRHPGILPVYDVGEQDEAKTTGTPKSRQVRPDSSERRQLSVVYGTREATTADEGTDLDAGYEQSLAFQALCREIIGRFDGLVIPATGTAFAACFGYPTAREDAPLAAVRAALAIHAEATSDSGSVVRVAVHTGLAVVVRPTPDATPAVVGDVMTAVTRIEPLVAGGGVRISATTHRLVQGYFDCEPAGEVQMRGAGAPVEIFRVRAERDARNRVEAADPAQLTPLIGRNREAELLQERWDLTVEGMGHVVLLVADPGLGKSRLVRVIREYVRSSRSHGEASSERPSERPSESGMIGPGGPDVVEWYCSPYHQDSPYYSVIDYFTRAFGLHRETAPGPRLDLLLRRLRLDGITDPDSAALFASLLSIPIDGRLPRLNLSPDRQKEMAREAILDWLRAQAERHPLLFVVEDLHWVDPSTQEVLWQFVEAGGSAQILAVFTFRPEYDLPWKGKANQTQVALTRLTRRQVGEMILAQTGLADVPPAVFDQIVDRTDGVPLFVEEFTKILVEGGKWAAGAANLAIPATLQDLLVARLDRIASNKDVVQLGAAIGRTFGYEMLHAVSELDETSLREELDKLVQAGLLFPKGSPPRCTYTFKHALIQDAAYQSLVKKRRQQVHQWIAEKLEQRFPDVVETQPELLAHHFTEAGAVDRAIVYWRTAGERAQARSAHIEAIRHLTRGLDLLSAVAPAERDARELAFRLPLSSSYLATRGYAATEVEEQIGRARDLCERLGPAAPLFQVTMVVWALRFIRGKNALSQTICDELLALAEARHDDGSLTEAHWAWGCTAWWAGDFATARDHLEQAIRTYDLAASVEHARFTQQNSGPLIVSYTGLALWALGFPEQAHQKAAEGVERAKQLGHPFTLAVTTWQTGFLFQLNGEPEAALEVADQVLAISREQSFAFWIALPTSLKGAALSLLGRHAEAIPLLRDGLRGVEGTGCEMVHQHFLGCLADALWAIGQRDGAWEALTRAFALTQRDQERYVESELYRRKAAFLVAESRDNLQAALDCLEIALKIAGKQKARFFELRAAIDRGRLWQATGRAAEARDSVRPLVEAFTEGLDSSDLVTARAFLGTLV